jgi:tRNA uridine 5-carbamoylmethylation protein Kti12
VPSIRHSLVELFHSYKARTKIVYIEVPYSRLINQNADREAKVPDNIMRQMIRKWEVPEVWEAVDVEYVVDGE